MNNADEIKRLMTVLQQIDISISNGEMQIFEMKNRTESIRQRELKLKKIFPDICELEQMQVNIMNIKQRLKIQEEEPQRDEEYIKEIKKELDDAQKSYDFTYKNLLSMGIRSRSDFDIAMDEVNREKMNFSDIEAEIRKKSEENRELGEKRISVENRLKRMEEQEYGRRVITGRDLSKKSYNKVPKSEISSLIDYSVESDESIVKIKNEKSENISVSNGQNIANNIPDTKQEGVENLGISVENSQRDIEEIISMLKQVEQETSLGLDKILQDIRRFNEESGIQLKELPLKVEEIKNRFNSNILQRTNNVAHKLLSNRKQIQDKEQQINIVLEDISKKGGSIKAVNDELENINAVFLKKTQEIEELQQKTDGDLKYDCNSLKEYIENETEYFKTLTQRIKEQSEDIKSTIDGVEENVSKNKLTLENNLKLDLEKLELELQNEIKKVDLSIESIEAEMNTFESEYKERVSIEESNKYKVKEEIIGTLDRVTEEIVNAESDEKFIEKLESAQVSIESKKKNVCEQIKVSNEIIEQLKNRKIELESRHTQEVENRDRNIQVIQQEFEQKKEAAKNEMKEALEADQILINDSKNMGKEQIEKLIQMVSLLNYKKTKFLEKVDKDKDKMSQIILKMDEDIINLKNNLVVETRDALNKINPLNEQMKDLNDKTDMEIVNLRGSLDKYLTNDIKEFNDEVKEIFQNINVNIREYELCLGKVYDDDLKVEFHRVNELLKRTKILLNDSMLKDKELKIQIEASTEQKVKVNVKEDIERNILKMSSDDNKIRQINLEEFSNLEAKLYKEDIDSAIKILEDLNARLDDGKQIDWNKVNFKEDEPEEIKEDEVEEQKNAEEIEMIEEENENIEERKEDEIEVDEVEMDTDLKIVESDEVEIEQKNVPLENKKNRRDRAIISGLEDYPEDIRETFRNIPWTQLIELKSMNRKHKKVLYLDDLKALKDESKGRILELKEEYKNAVMDAKKLYDIKKHVVAYKKGIEELATGGRAQKDDSKEKHVSSMKTATRALKVMKENGVESFEDFRSKVIKNSELVKEIMSRTKAENEELVKLNALIQSIEKGTEQQKNIREL